MRSVRRTGGFNRDLKRLSRRGSDLKRLASMLDALARGESLPAVARPHPLKGEWKGYWEFHVAPDWLVIYKLSAVEVLLARTGTHADLFHE